MAALAAPGTTRLRELFAARFASGEDLGVSLAVNLDGEMGAI